MVELEFAKQSSMWNSQDDDLFQLEDQAVAGMSYEDEDSQADIPLVPELDFTSSSQATTQGLPLQIPTPAP